MGFMNQIMSLLPEGAFSSQQPGNVGQMEERIPSGYRKFSLNQYTPEQTDLYSQLFPHLGKDSYLSKLASGDQSAFADIEAPALRQFNELQGGLASRFSGMGLGGRNSSGFRNTSSAAAQDFASQLQSQRQGLQRQALQDLMGYSESLLNQRPYDQGFAKKRQKQSSGWGSLAGAGIGAAGGFFAGGPLGALTGAQIGSEVGSAF